MRSKRFRANHGLNTHVVTNYNYSSPFYTGMLARFFDLMGIKRRNA